MTRTEIGENKTGMPASSEKPGTSAESGKSADFTAPAGAGRSVIPIASERMNGPANATDSATPIMHTVTANASSAPHVLSIEQVSKLFGNKDSITTALDEVSLSVEKREFVAIMGPSGSGKSTLLNCVATIEPVTSGKITLGGRDITRLRGAQLSRFRRDDLGFIFQDSNLLDTLTGYENIALALTLKGAAPSTIDDQVRAIACRLNVGDVLDKFPPHMSGGQRQRVAAARAIVANPKLILADEPTGALDSRNSTILLETLKSMNEDMDATIMMVTHDAFAASYSSRTVFIRDGRVFNQVLRGDDSRESYYRRLMDVVSFLGGATDVL